MAAEVTPLLPVHDIDQEKPLSMNSSKAADHTGTGAGAAASTGTATGTGTAAATALANANISSPHELTDWVDSVLDQLESRFDSMSGQVEGRSE